MPGILHKNRRPKAPARLVGALFLAAVLAGCVSGGGGGGGNVVSGPPPDEQARTLLAAGNYPAAASEYLRLADQASPKRAAAYRAVAANALLSTGDALSARRLMAGPAPAGLDAEGRTLRDLYSARIALADGDAQTARALLPPDAAVWPEFVPVVARTRVEVLSATGAAPLDVARARTELDLLLTDPAEREANHALLWRALLDTNRASLAAAAAPPPDTFGGWVELAEINALYVGDPDTLANELDRWQIRYPGHPAWFTMVPRMRETSNQLSGPVDRVALLLPLSGRFAAAGAAVRDGFVAAWLAGRGATSEAALRVIDTESEDAAAAYTQAVDAGTQFVVGPLRKEAITSIIEGSGVRVPTLALNAVDWPDGDSRPAGLFQMALSPEQEAAQVAERIWYDGHVTVAMIAPEGDWGERVADAFALAFENLGGRVVESQSFDPTSRDLSAPVARMLNIEDSVARYKELRALLRADIKHELRRRQDIDAIFMASFASQARLLRPQLRFHRASNVPVYATSHVYAGSPNPNQDRDIDGVMFGDMPWILDANLDADPVKRELLIHFSEAMAGYSRLFALGADAAGVIGQLGRLRSGSVSAYTGYTGELNVDSNNVVVRKLTWAQFREGLAEPIDGFGGIQALEAPTPPAQ